MDTSKMSDALPPGFHIDEPAAGSSNLPAGFELDEDKYGSPLEVAKTFGEGLAEGVGGPLATYAEKHFLHIKPEERAGRKEENPVPHFFGQTVGLGVSALTGVGEGAVLAKAGEGAAALSGLGKGAGALSQIGAAGVRGAAELATLQSGDEISKMIDNDPGQTLGSAAANIGLSGILGGVGGAGIGSISPLWRASVGSKLQTALDSAAEDVGLAENEAQNGIPVHASTSDQAPEVRAAARALGVEAPEGMLSDNKWVQRAEDSLINGAPTYSGIKRAKIYKNVYDKALGAIDEVLPDERLSKAQIGDQLKEGITSQIEKEHEPINNLYSAVKSETENIPIGEKSLSRIAGNLRELQAAKLDSSASSLVKMIEDSLEHVESVDQVKDLRKVISSSVVKHNASDNAKYVLSEIQDRLKSLEERTIENHANRIIESHAERMAGLSPEAALEEQGIWGEKISTLENLLAQKKQADTLYKPFITKIKTLAEQLGGKNRVGGAQGAINFIQDLTPENLTQKLFSKNNSEFLNFFSKNFPEEMSKMREYQKAILREESTFSGQLNPKAFFKKVNKLEPEIQKALFSPEELTKIGHAETLINNMPKAFNPSGTDHTSAFRAFFESPAGAAIANARDYALEHYITKFSGLAQESAPGATKIVLKKALENPGDHSAEGFKSGVDYVAQAIKGDKMFSRAAASLFKAGAEVLGTSAIPDQKSREKLEKRVNAVSDRPESLLNVGGSVGHYLPDHGNHIATAALQATKYLKSIEPKPVQTGGILDKKTEVPKYQKAAYDRALDIADQPLMVVAHIKSGTLQPQDVQTLKAIYPGAYQKLSQHLTESLVDHLAKGEMVPLKQRQSLSLFLGQPLDSSQTAQSAQIIQSLLNKPKQEPQGPAQKQHKPSDKASEGLSKLASMGQTQLQAREAQKIKN